MSAAVQLAMSGLEAEAKVGVRRRRPPGPVLVLAALKSTGVPMLVEEIARATHLPLSSVAARVGELLRRGEVLPADYRTTSTGRRGWAYALPASLPDEARRRAERWALHVIANRGRWVPSPDDQCATWETPLT